MRHKPNPTTQCQHRTKDRKQCQMPASVAQTSARPRQGAAAPSISVTPNLCPHHQRTAANQIYQSTQSSCSGGSFYPEPRRADPFFSSRHKATRSAEEIEALATALLTNTNNLSDPAQVNQFLANLLNQLAHNKISRKNAIAMAYISQLLLNSISVKHKQDRDAQAAQQAADAAKPTQIVIDMPRPLYDSPTEPEPETVPTAAQKNPPPPPPPLPSDDPPPSTHPQHTPLPRWGEQHFHNGTLTEPARPNTYGPPRMHAKSTALANRRRSRRPITRLDSTGTLVYSPQVACTGQGACARLLRRRDSAMDHRRSAKSVFSLHLSCFA